MKNSVDNIKTKYFNILIKRMKLNKDGNPTWKIDSLIRNEYTVYSEYIFRELFPQNRNPTLKRIFSNKLTEKLKKKESILDWSVFRDNIVEDLQNYPLKKFLIGFAFPLKSTNNEAFPFKRINIQGISFRTLTHKEFQKKYPMELLVRHYEQRHKTQSVINSILWFLFFEAEILAIDDRHAVDICESIWTPIIAAINTSNGYGRFTSHLNGRTPEFAITTPEVYLVSDGAQVKPYYEYNPQYILKPFENLRIIRRNKIYLKCLQIIRKGEKLSELESIFLQSIISYDKALKSASRADSFINYWRILEFQSNQKEQKNDEIVRNFSKFWKEEDMIAVAKLITDERNSLVHLGSHDEYSDMYTNWVKEYTEQALKIILYLLYHGFKNKEDIIYFHSHYSKDKKSIQNKLRLLNKIYHGS